VKVKVNNDDFLTLKVAVVKLLEWNWKYIPLFQYFIQIHNTTMSIEEYTNATNNVSVCN